jgi:hypothetical protein
MYIDPAGQAHAFNSRSLYRQDSGGVISYNGNGSGAYLQVLMSSAPDLAKAVRVGSMVPGNCYASAGNRGWYLTSANDIYFTSLSWNCIGYTVGNANSGNVNASKVISDVDDVIQFNPQFLLARKTTGQVYVVNSQGTYMQVEGADWNGLKNHTDYYYRDSEAGATFFYKAGATWNAINVFSGSYVFSGLAAADFLGPLNLEDKNYLYWWSGPSSISSRGAGVYDMVSTIDAPSRASVKKMLGFTPLSGVGGATNSRTSGAFVYIDQSDQVVVHAVQRSGGPAAPSPMVVDFGGTTTVNSDDISVFSLNGIEGTSGNITSSNYVGLRIANMTGTVYQIAVDTSSGNWTVANAPTAGVMKVYPGTALFMAQDGKVYPGSRTNSVASIAKSYFYSSTPVASSESALQTALDYKSKKLVLFTSANGIPPMYIDGTAGSMTSTANVSMRYIDQMLTPSSSVSSYSFSSKASGFDGQWTVNPYAANAQGLNSKGLPYAWGYLAHSISYCASGCNGFGYLYNAAFRDPQPLILGAAEGKVPNFAASKGAHVDQVSLSWNPFPGATNYVVTNNSSSTTPKSWNVAASNTSYIVNPVIGSAGTNVLPNVGTRFMIAANFNHPVYNNNSSTPLSGVTGNAGLTNTTPSQCTSTERDDPACGWLASGPTDAVATATVAANSSSNNVSVVVTDADNPVDIFTYTVLAQPTHGTAQVGADGKSLLYTPSANYVGADSFGFRVTDKAGFTYNAIANVTVTCPAPQITKVTLPTNAMGYATSIITMEYTANTCNGSLTANFAAVKAGTGEPLPEFDQSYNLVSTAGTGTATFVLNNPAPGSLNTTITLKSNTYSENVATSNGVLAINGYGTYALTLNKSLATEDDLIVANVTTTSTSCTMSSESDAYSNRQCFVRWVTNPLVSSSFPTVTSAQGYLVAGNNIQFAAEVVKVDSAGAPHVLQTVYQVVTVLPGVPMTVKSIAFAKSTYRQFVDPVSIDIVRNTGYDCVMTSDPAKAKFTADQGQRSCLVEFTVLPDGLVADPAGAPGIRGRVADISTNGHVEWQVKKVFSSMPAEVMVTGKFDIPVGEYSLVPAVGFDKPGYAVNYSTARVTADVSGVSPIGSTQCSPTASLDDARLSWLSPSGAPKCLVEWTAIPAGLTAGIDINTKNPQLTGIPTDMAANGVGYNLSWVDNKGKKTAIGSAVAQMSIVSIVNPSVTITPAVGTATDSGAAGTIYLSPDNGLVGSFLLSSGDYATTKATIVEDNSVPVVISGIANGATKPLQLTPNKPAWFTRNVQLKLQYESMAGATPVTTNFRAVQMPSSKVAVALVPPTTALVDTIPFSLTISVGELLSGSTLSYDSTKHGPWNGYLAAKIGDTLFPITTSQSVDANTGKTTFTNLNYFDFAGQEIYAVSQAVAPSNLTLDIPVPTIQTATPLNLTFKRGLALVASATVTKPTGAVPLAEILDLTMSKDDAAALKSVVWQVSTDSGVTWNPLGITGRGAKYTFTKGGAYLVRGLMTNMYSGIQSFSGSAAISAVEMLKPVLSGNDYALPGQTIVLTAGATDGLGKAVSSFDTRWTIAKGDGSSSVIEGEPSVSVTAAATDVVNVTLEVKAKTMPAADPGSWTAVSKQIMFVIPNAPKITLTGAKSIEANKSGHFIAKIANPWPVATVTSLTVAGKWILPDGTENTNPEIDYMPLNATEPVQTLKYRAWVVGAEEQTTVEASISTNVWVYKFPTFILKAQVDSMYAPAYLKLQIAPATLDDAKLLVGKKLTYTWTATEGLAFKNGASSIFVGMSMPGTYDFTGVVADDRGNKQEFTYQLVLGNMKPYVFDFTLVEALKYNRNPMVYGVKPTISGGHPKDRITQITTKIDGTQVGLVSTRFPGIVTIPTSGEHTVEISFVSALGATASAQKTVTVGVNQPPVCTPKIIPMTPTVSKITANCIDPDGKMTAYTWAVDGVLLPKSMSNYLYYTMPADKTEAVITVNGKDDSGAITSADITVTLR